MMYVNAALCPTGWQNFFLCKFCAQRSRPTRKRPCGSRRCCERCSRSCSRNSQHSQTRNCSRCCTPRPSGQDVEKYKRKAVCPREPWSWYTRIGITGDAPHSRFWSGIRGHCLVPVKIRFVCFGSFFLFLSSRPPSRDPGHCVAHIVRVLFYYLGPGSSPG